MAQPERYYKGFNGEKIEIVKKNPSKDLTPAQRKIYNYLKGIGRPKTEKEISILPAFHDISDVGRALRKMREYKDPVTGRPLYVESYSQRNGPQLWEARR